MIDPVIQAAEQRQWSTVLAEVQQECLTWQSRALAAEAALAAEREENAALSKKLEIAMSGLQHISDMEIKAAAAIRAEGE